MVSGCRLNKGLGVQSGGFRDFEITRYRITGFGFGFQVLGLQFRVKS